MPKFDPAPPRACFTCGLLREVVAAIDIIEQPPAKRYYCSMRYYLASAGNPNLMTLSKEAAEGYPDAPVDN